MPRLPLVVAALRTAVARRPRIRRRVRALVVTALVVSAWSLFGSVGDARDRWGDTVDVLVATVALAPGDDLDTVEVIAWPVALAPVEPLTVADRRTVVRRHVGPGEVLTAADVGRGRGAAGLVPDGWSATHVRATADQRALVAVGDPIVVVVDGRRITNGIAVAVGTESIAVAVPDDTVALVTQGALDGSAAIALAPR